MKKTITSLMLCSAVLFANAELIKNDFFAGYAVGDDLEKGAYSGTSQGDAAPLMVNQWNLSGKPGANDQSEVSASAKMVAPLTYAGYVESGEGVAAELLMLEAGGRTAIYSLASDNNTYGAGTYYLAFLSNVSEATTSANEFLSFDGNYTGNAQRVRYTVQGVDETTYKVGLFGNTASADAIYCSNALNFNQTYLSVIKLTLNGAENEAGTGEGDAWLWINPDLSQGEPAEAMVTVPFSGTALRSIRGLVLRQRASLAAQVGGLRFATTWADAVGPQIGDGSNVNTVNGDDNAIKAVGNSIMTTAGTISIFNLAGVEVVSQQATSGRFEASLPNGLYIVSFVDAQGLKSAARVIIK